MTFKAKLQALERGGSLMFYNILRFLFRKMQQNSFVS